MDHLEKYATLMSQTRVTQRVTSPFQKIIATTFCCLAHNMTSCEDMLNALVKRAAKAKSNHVTLNILEDIRVATVANFTLEEGNDRSLRCR